MIESKPGSQLNQHTERQAWKVEYTNDLPLIVIRPTTDSGFELTFVLKMVLTAST